MASLVPTVMAVDAHDYRAQMERVAAFAAQVHIDCTDGVFAPTKSPPIGSAWWPEALIADLHTMYQRPLDHLEDIIRLKPHLVIVHAEADGDFARIAEALHQADIRTGVALLAETPVNILDSSLEMIDHVLIFSGKLGHFGGEVDLGLLDKVRQLKSKKPALEIGWDGGINQSNIAALVAGGVDVLNVGGAIQKAANPQAAYDTLKAIAEN